jgi:hypothetical protein
MRPIVQNLLYLLCCSPYCPILYANRAMCHIKLKNYKDALYDGWLATICDVHYVKVSDVESLCCAMCSCARSSSESKHSSLFFRVFIVCLRLSNSLSSPELQDISSDLDFPFFLTIQNSEPLQ